MIYGLLNDVISDNTFVYCAILWVIILSLSINTPVQTYILYVLNGPSMLAGIEQFWLVLDDQSTFYRFKGSLSQWNLLFFIGHH